MPTAAPVGRRWVGGKEARQPRREDDLEGARPEGEIYAKKPGYYVDAAGAKAHTERKALGKQGHRRYNERYTYSTCPACCSGHDKGC